MSKTEKKMNITEQKLLDLIDIIVEQMTTMRKDIREVTEVVNKLTESLNVEDVVYVDGVAMGVRSDWSDIENK
jgi:hypothetical protein